MCERRSLLRVAFFLLCTCQTFPVNAQSRLDAYGDPLPDGALFRLGTLRWRQDEGVMDLAFTPAGELRSLAAGGHVLAWDRVTGKVSRRWQVGPIKSEFPHSFSEDGQKLLGNRGVWDAASGKSLVAFGDPLGIVRLCADQKSVVGLSDKGVITRRDIGKPAVRQAALSLGNERNLELASAGHPFAVRQASFYLDFSPDGKMLAAFRWENQVHLFDTATGKELRRLKGHKDLLHCMAFSPDSRYLATAAPTQVAGGAEEPVIVWDVARGREVRRLLFPRPDPSGAHLREPTFLLTFSRDSKLLAAWDGRWSDEPICIWELATGKVRQLSAYPEVPRVLCFSQDGKYLATGTEIGTILLWDIQTAKLLGRPSGRLEYFPRYPRYALGGRALMAEHLTGKTAGRIGCWDMAPGNKSQTLPGREIFAVSPDGRQMFVRDDDGRAREPTVALVDVPTGKVWRRFACSTPLIKFAADGKHAALLDDVIRVVRVSDGKLEHEFQVPGKDSKPRRIVDHRQAAAISPDLKYFIHVENDKGITRLWEVATGKERWRSKDLGSTEGSQPVLLFSSDSKYMVAGARNVLLVWDVATGKKLHKLEQHDGCPSFVGATATLAYQRENDLDLLDLDSGKRGSLPDAAPYLRPIYVLVGNLRLTFCPHLPASADGKIVAVDSDDIELRERVTGQVLRRFRGALDQRHLIYSPNGMTLTSAEGLASVLVWDVTGLNLAGRNAAIPLSDSAFERCWADLASSDGPRVLDAFWKLAADPKETVRRLKENFRPPPFDIKLLPVLLKDLASTSFAVREKASRQLEHEDALPGLRKSLGRLPDLETRRRVQAILNKLEGGPLDGPGNLRRYRAVQVLEQIRTPEAARLLGELTQGAVGTLLTREARASLGRLRRPATAGTISK